MNFKSLMTKFGFLILLFTLVTGASFAQTTWYVNATNGDDSNNDGKSATQVTASSGPFKTIGTALTAAADGDVISIACDTYAEAQLSITKAVRLVSTPFQSRTTATINNGIKIAASGKTVYIGKVADGSSTFTLKSATALELADGQLLIDAANVIVDDGAKIIRSKAAATINVTPTVSNVFVDYNAAESLTAGAELPGNLGTGSLSFKNTAGTVTVDKNITISTGAITITNAGGNAVINGTVTVSNTGGNSGSLSSTANAGKSITFNGAVVFNTKASGAATTGAITNGAGNMVFGSTITFNENNFASGGTVSGTITNGAGNLTLGAIASISSHQAIALTNGAGKIVLNGGTINGTVANNTASGIIELNASTTFAGATIGNNTATSKIKLNGYTLTLTKVTALNNAGTIYSSTVGEVGTGKLLIASDGNVTLTGNGDLPSVEINIGSKTLSTNNIAANQTIKVYGDVTVTSGTLNLDDNADDSNVNTLTVSGSVTQNGGTINLGNGTTDAIVNIAKDFVRTSGTFTAGHGTLNFNGTINQTFTPGPSLVLYNLAFDNAGKTLSLDASLTVNNSFTIAHGKVALGTYNIRMQGGTFDNGTTSSDGYTSVGGGGVIFESANAGTIQGAGIFSNLDIRTTGVGNNVTLASNIAVSGVIRLRSNNLVTDTYTLTLSDAYTRPSIEKYSAASKIDKTGGAIAVSTDYNLSVLTNTDVIAANLGAEYDAVTAPKIFNFTVATGSNGNPYTTTLPAVDGTVAGTFTVNGGQTLALAAAANMLTLAGDNMVHSVAGKVTTGILDVTGRGSALNGSTESTYDASVNALTVTLVDGATFTSTNLKEIDGDLTISGGSNVTIDMNDEEASLTGNTSVDCANGSVTLKVNSAATTHTGNVTVVKGILNYTGNDNQTITGNVDLQDGKLVLGSAVTVTGTTAIAKGELANGTYAYTAKGAVSHTDEAGTISGTGNVVLNYAGNLTLTKALSVANLVVKSAGTVTIQTDSLNVNNSLTLESGVLDINGNKLTVTGNTVYTKVASLNDGAGTGLFRLQGSNLVLTSEGNFAMPIVEVKGKTTFASDKETGDGATARAFSTTAFTQTAGDVALGINSLTVTDFTRAAGAWSMNGGKLVFNNVGEFVPGAGLAVDYLEVKGGAANNDANKNEFTVNKYLKLTSNLDANGDSKLILGAGATVERNGGALAAKPVFGTTVNLVYTAGATVTMDKEVPADDRITNITVTNGVTTKVVANKDLKVNGTLSLAQLLSVDPAGEDYTITMADNTNLELAVAGTTALDKDLVKLGKLNLVYAAPVTTTTRELGEDNGKAGADKAYPTATGNVTVKGLLTLDGAITVGGTLTFDGANIDQTGSTFTVNVNGDLVQKTNNFFVDHAASVNFGGASNTKLTLKQDMAVSANIKLRFAKTNATNTVTLEGGSLDFTANKPYFQNGLLVTGDNVVILKQGNAGGQPTQGFDNSGVTGTNRSFVVGNVKKKIDKDAGLDISFVTFPVGTANAEYRPMNMYFKTVPQSTVNLTVSHADRKAGGSNGFPITAGTKQITNYPEFFWYVKSDQALAPSYKYDMEAQAEGYTDYKEGIQNVRFVRRDSGSVANPWGLQGADNAYDNFAATASKPTVKVIDAMGGITTQGSIFSFSQANKAPVFASQIGKIAKAEGDTVKATYTATDPDFGQTVTLSATQIPAGSTFDAATGKFNWVIGYDKAGTHVVKIKATDSQGASFETNDTIVVANTNRAPVFAAHATKMFPSEDADFSYQFAATDADGEALTFSKVSVAGDADTKDSVKVSATGKLTWKPGFGEVNKLAIVTVQVSDGIANVTTVDTLCVQKTNRAPQFAVTSDSASVDEGQAYTKTFTATDADGNTLAYTVAGDDTTAKINASTGVFTWTPSYKSAGLHTFVVTATDNGTPAMSATSTLKLNVVNKNAVPVFTAVLPADTVLVGDTLTFQYKATDADGDVLTYALENAPVGASIDSKTGAFTWVPQSSQTAIYVIKATVTDGVVTTPVKVSTEVLVKVVTVAVTGKVTYDGSTVAVPGVEVSLTQGSTTLKATTDAAGNYSIANVNAGTYTVSASKTTGWGGVNATDALLAALYSVDATANPLTDAQKLAADVTNNGTVNASDAMVIVQKFVDPSVKFQTADWLFVPAQTTLTVGTKAVVNNISAIAAGDVDRSMAKGTISKETGSFSVNTNSVQKIAPKATFTLPVKVDEAVSLGAVSMQISYPADLVKFEGVSGADGMIAKDVNGTITIGWFNAAKPMNLKADDVIASLKFSATEKFAKGQIMSVTVANNSEFVNAQGKVQNIALKIANVEASVPQVFALNQNYPNPFNPTTTIAYDLPVDGKVMLQVYNSLGQVVSTLVNEIQTAGSYKYNWNANSMSSGVYYYRITVEGQKGFTATHKMILMK